MLLLLATGGLPLGRLGGGGENVSIWLIDFYVNVKPFCGPRAFGSRARDYRIGDAWNRVHECGFAQSRHCLPWHPRPPGQLPSSPGRLRQPDRCWTMALPSQHC